MKTQAAKKGARGRARLVVAYVVTLGAAVASFAALAFVIALDGPLPVVRGELTVPGLGDRVEVLRDGRGIPHIYAKSQHDLFVAQGWVHAQDRFWQMDFWRHVGSGRLAELFGSKLVDTDVFLRTLGWARLAEKQHEAVPRAQQEVLGAYAEGVNGYIAARGARRLSMEHTLLALQAGYEPEPWRPEHSITWGMVMAWDLSGNMGDEIARAVLEGRLSRRQVDQLHPPYPHGRHPTIVPRYDEASVEEPAEPEALSPSVREALSRLAARVDALDSIAGGGGNGLGIGSNSWVVSAERSATGGPVLANDPHLAIQMPSIWYQVGLHCEPVSAECPIDVVGFSFAGVPGVIIGHNARIAWGLTNLGPDVMDLYVERLHPDGSDRYEVDGEWRPLETRTETILVAGGEPVELTVRATRHGPIVSDAYGPLKAFGDQAAMELPDRFAVSLRWTALDPGPPAIETFYRLNAAKGWDDFREALRSFPYPSQNFVYADVEGNIGYQAPGRIPIRAKGDGRRPVPGWTSEHEWTGYIDFDELPRELNPERGYVVTANNAVVGPGYPHFLGYDWSHGYRARRIVDRIEEARTLTVADHQSIQMDSYSLNAERVLPFLLALDLGDGSGAAAQELLAGWDRRMERGSAAAALYGAFWRRLLEKAFHDDLPPDRHPYGNSRWYAVVHDLLDAPDDPLWDDRGTPEQESRDDVLRWALERAERDLEERLGPVRERWSWGRLHVASFVHQTFGKSGVGPLERLFNRPGFPVSGGSSLVLANGWDAAEGFEVTWLPSMRMVVDLADLSRSTSVHTTGQSGHPRSPRYDDLIRLWADGESYPMLWTREEVEGAARARLALLPD